MAYIATVVAFADRSGDHRIAVPLWSLGPGTPFLPLRLVLEDKGKVAKHMCNPCIQLPDSYAQFLSFVIMPEQPKPD